MPPSTPWSQLLSWITLETSRCVAGVRVHANWGSGGRSAGGPMYAHRIPPASTIG